MTANAFELIKKGLERRGGESCAGTLEKTVKGKWRRCGRVAGLGLLKFWKDASTHYLQNHRNR